MADRPHYTPADIIEKLGLAAQYLGNGMSMTQMCRELKISELTYYR